MKNYDKMTKRAVTLKSSYMSNAKWSKLLKAIAIRTKNIEYVIIPFESINELSRMKDLIEKIGKFEYDIDNEKLIIKIFGYR